MNLIPGAISGGAAFLPDRTATPMPVDADGDGSETSVLGLRSERLAYLPHGVPPARPMIHAPAPVVDERVRLAMAPDSVHLVDRDTGQRL